MHRLDQRDWRLAKTSGALERSDDQAYCAIGGQTVVEKTQRSRNISRVQILPGGQRSLHYGSCVQCRMTATRDWHGGKEMLSAAVPVLIQIAAVSHAVKCSRRADTEGFVIHVTAAAPDLNSVPLMGRSLIGGIDERYVLCQTGLNDHAGMAESDGAHSTAQGIRRHRLNVAKAGTLSEWHVRERFASAGYEAIDLPNRQASVVKSIPENS